MYLTKHQEKSYEYYEEFRKKLEEGLDDNQRKDLGTLEDVKSSASAAEFNYQVLYGMRVKEAFDQMIKNPLKILELYESNATDTREIYKSVKQLKEENKNK